MSLGADVSALRLEAIERGSSDTRATLPFEHDSDVYMNRQSVGESAAPALAETGPAH